MQTKHKIITIILSVIMLITVFCTTCTPVFANAYNGTPEQQKEELGSTKYKLWTMSKAVFAAGDVLYNDDGTPSDLMSVINIDPKSSTNGGSNPTSTVWGYAKSIYNNILPIGYLLIILFFLIDLIEKTTTQELSVEHFIRMILKMLVAILLMLNGMEILEGCLAVSGSLVTMVTNSFSNSNTVSATAVDLQLLYDEISNYSTILAIFEMMTLIMPYLATLIANVVITILCWSRFLELGARVALAPVGMADLFSSGLNGSGFRYLKKTIAVMLQGVVMIAIILMMGAINYAFSFGTEDTALEHIGLLFVEIAALKKSQTMANDLLGV